MALAQCRNQISLKLSGITGVSRAKILTLLQWNKNEADGDLYIAIPSLMAAARTQPDLYKDENEGGALDAKTFPVQLDGTRDLAEIGRQIEERYTDYYKNVSVSTKGIYLNFTLSADKLTGNVLKQIHDEKNKYGMNGTFTGKSAIVEFSSPNIAKPFHAGHLRSTVLGGFIERILRMNGYKTVTKINYLGDWGKQYGMLAVGFKLFGSQKELKIDAIKHLYDVYVKVNKLATVDPRVDEKARSYFRRMEKGNSSILQLWTQLRVMSIDKYTEMYERLGVWFHRYEGESVVQHLVPDVLENLRLSKISHYEENGSEVCDLSDKDLGTCVVKKKDGSALYITRDIATAVKRQEDIGFDVMYYVVAKQQDLHFKQLFEILRRLKYTWADRCNHVSFGMVQGMSTRKGDVVFLEQILDEAEARMLEKIMSDDKFKRLKNPKATAAHLGVSAVVVQDFMARSIKDYTFSWDRILQSEGDTGVFIQYTHARLCSLKNKYDQNDLFRLHPHEQRKKQAGTLMTDGALLGQANAITLVKHLAKYPEIVAQAGKTLEPSTIVQYTLKLCHLVGSCYDNLSVLDPLLSRDVAMARMSLYSASQIVLASAITSIGLTPLKEV
eukprot:CFRG2764T1